MAASDHLQPGQFSGWTYDRNIVGQVTARGPAGERQTVHTFLEPGLNQASMRHPADRPATLYHGSNREFSPGDMVEAGHPGNFASRMSHVYMTEQAEGDESYKGARGYGRHVYEVQPTGWYGHRRDARGDEWASNSPLRVVRRLPGREGGSQ